MTGWSNYLFGAVVFFGAGSMMLSRTASEWWTTTSIAVTFLAALVFLVRSIIEYRSSRSAPKDSEHISLI